MSLEDPIEQSIRKQNQEMPTSVGKVIFGFEVKLDPITDTLVLTFPHINKRDGGEELKPIFNKKHLDKLTAYAIKAATACAIKAAKKDRTFGGIKIRAEKRYQDADAADSNIEGNVVNVLATKINEAIESHDVLDSENLTITEFYDRINPQSATGGIDLSEASGPTSRHHPELEAEVERFKAGDRSDEIQLEDVGVGNEQQTKTSTSESDAKPKFPTLQRTHKKLKSKDK